MPDVESGMAIEDLVDGEDLELLKAEARKRGMTLQQMAKYGIQQKLTDRTRPKAMAGTIQAFRRKID